MHAHDWAGSATVADATTTMGATATAAATATGAGGNITVADATTTMGGTATATATATATDPAPDPDPDSAAAAAAATATGAGAAAAAPAASVTTARAPPPRQHVVGEVCRYSRNGTVPKVDVTIKHIEPPLPDDTTEFFTIEFSTGDQRQVTGSELEPTTTTLSPEAAGDRVRASTAQPVTEEVTSTTKAFLGSAGPWMRNKIEKGKWPWWACMVEGPTDTAAGLHCKLCHEHAPLDFNGERSG